MTPTPILDITDGTTTINLLDINGILLYDWVPNLPEPKGGGVWSDSPLFEGRKLAYAQLGNIIDTFELKVRGSSQDDAIFKLQELRRLLEKARQYWTSDAQNEPVYLRARAAFETNTRYAVIHDYRTPRDNNPFKQPFFSCDPLVDNFLLSIEHGIWQDNVPGSSACVEISSIQSFAGAIQVETAEPAESGDDASKDNFGTWFIAQTLCYFGVSNKTGVRFYDVDVPNGANIVNAWVEFVCGLATSDTPINVIIHGDDVDNSAIFSTEANYDGRTRTAAAVNWNNIPAWTLGVTYSTPNLTAIVQEIVNRAGWASGNYMGLLFDNNGTPNFNRQGAAWDFPGHAYAPPKLYIQYTSSTPTDYGRSATCNAGEVFAANKHNRAQITNIYYYDASVPSFSGNLQGEALPYAFLPATPAIGDIVYFGISTAVSDSGPFSSLVFDITTAAAAITGLVWEYYNGAWVTLTVQDNVSYAALYLNRLGIASIHWAQPSDWTATAINGVTAFWVRARVFAGGVMTPPSQGNRDIYTAAWPYVDWVSDQVGGDIPALGRFLAVNKSDAPSGSPILHTNRLIVGSRSLSRGENFSAYLNISDEQNPSGVTVTLGSNTAYSNVSDTPTGRLATYTSPVGAGTTTEVTIALNSTLSPEYLGRFRAFLRYKYNTGVVDAVSMRLVTTPGGSGLAKYSDYIYPQVNTDWQVADFGIVNILHLASGDRYGNVSFAIEITRDTSGRVIYLYDLVLIPVDEWSTDAVDESGLAARTGAIGNGDYLDVDSVRYPRRTDHAVLRNLSNGSVIGYFQNRQPGPVLLQANAAQRLWFLALMYESGTELSSPPSIAHTIRVYRVNRYLSARGRR